MMIAVTNAVFSYTGAPPYVLNGIDFHVDAGDYLSVVGDNGSGKSTLMRLILGFLKPISGSVAVSANRIGYVPQKNDAVHSGFPITVFEALDSYQKLLKLKDAQAVPQALARIGMADASSSLMSALSGGQHQKVMIARALLGNPDLIVLDEPSSGVDIHSQREIYSFLKRLNREQGVTIVSVEHNLEAAIENSTAIYHLAQGHGHSCSPGQYADEMLRRKDL